MSFASQHHSFDIALAAMYGVNEALIIHNFQHWIRLNRAAGRNIKDGRCWTYQTKKEIKALFPYLTFAQVRHALDKLVKMGVMRTANYNKNPIDKTLWYSFENEEAFGVDEKYSKNLYESEISPSRSEISPSTAKFHSPIPDTKSSYPKEKIKKEEVRPASGSAVLPADAVELARFFFSKIREMKKDFKEPNLEKWAKELDKMIRIDKRDPKKIREVIEWVVTDPFWQRNILSAEKLRLQFDRLEIDREKGKTDVWKKSNIKLCLEEKEAHPGPLKCLLIKGDYAINTNTQKEVNLRMNPDAFEDAFMHVFGGRRV
jgi:hypothetical protein